MDTRAVSKLDVKEMASFNVDDLDVEELEQRLEQAASSCDCWSNGCGTYCNTPPPAPTPTT
jgi:hypothetical protein